MTNFIELNMKNSITSLELTDTELKIYNADRIKPLRKCDVCGIPENIVILYDGLCKHCAEHYIFD